VLLHRWRHWEEPNVRFDLDLELTRLSSRARGFQNGEAAEALVCKSLGTFVAAALLVGDTELAGRIRRLVFMGLPITGPLENEKDQLQKFIKEWPRDLVIIQNRADPFADEAETSRFLSGTAVAAQFHDANTHTYRYPDAVAAALR